MRSNRFIIIFFGLVIVIVVASMVSSYVGSFQDLVVSSSEKFNMKIYPAEHDADTIKKTQNKPSKTIDKPGKYRLKKGLYLYTYSSPNKEFNTVDGNFDLQDKKVFINIKSFSYTDEKLAAMLVGEQTAINKAIVDRYPEQMKNYEIKNGRLYNQGEWFGATLYSKDRENLDDLKIILKKDKGQWTVATTPPDIVLSQPVYKNIPFNILSQVNNN